MRIPLSILLILGTLSIYAQGPFAPQANQTGTLAIHADSNVFVAWASRIEVQRGRQDIAVPNSDTTTVGSWTQCFGKANGTVVSLGDSGVATVQFEGLIYNGVGPDFAVFENAFNHTFLELAFVEVSSNGIDFHRFPSYSLTDTSIAVGSFGSVDPTGIHNLAGKYSANYGTPFDLSDLDSIIELDVSAISHIRIVDAVGSLNERYTQRDCKGRKVNDQYPTAFPSGGFDFDAVGVIYMKGVGLSESYDQSHRSIYPNPSNGVFYVDHEGSGLLKFELRDFTGRVMQVGLLETNTVDFTSLLKGAYLLQLIGKERHTTHKIVIQ